MATIFISPGVYIKEQDFTVFASRIGITRLGLVGKTVKGPAFENIKVKSADEYALRFGGTNSDYPLSYVANSFLGQSDELNIVRILGYEGYTNSKAWVLVATGGTLAGSVLAVLRSKKNQILNLFTYSAATNMEIGVTTAPLADFVVSGSTGALASGTYYTVSLDETKDNFIANVFGRDPLPDTSKPDIYVEYVFPHFVREAVQRGQLAGGLALRYESGTSYTDYTDNYTNSVTPWIVSNVVGGTIQNLFRVHTIADGDGSAEEIKISIARIDVLNKTFDLIVRRFEDTDATASSTALETWSNVTMDKSKSNFIGKIIGTNDEEYPQKSMFIAIELPTNWSTGLIPAGFRGYPERHHTSGTTQYPFANIYYKQGYASTDAVSKTYLGTSELGYTGLTKTMVSTRVSVQSLEKDLFKYQGGVATTATTLGFHMESTAPTSLFVTGFKASLSAYTNDAGTLTDKNKLKFTVAPYGGFDGFDKTVLYADLYEEFTDYYVNNVNAFKAAIDVMQNPEEVDINIFATPGIDYSNNTTLVNYGLDMVEERADALYIIDAPRVTTSSTDKGTPEEAVNSLENTGIDTNYACTYWPWIQIEDSATGVYTWQSPTLLAAKTMAYTDNVAAPWWAPAGLNRAKAGTSVKAVDIKLDKSGRDTLYEGRINPIASFVQQGIVIWGQKTLQQQTSALDRINIRRLLLQTRRLVAAAALTLVFEQNDQTLRDQFLAKVEPILLQIQNQRGLTSFKVVMDETNNTAETIDRNQLIGKIQIKPTPSSEYVDLTFQILPTGANFEDF